jgi:hypothetical protein
MQHGDPASSTSGKDKIDKVRRQVAQCEAALAKLQASVSH